MTWEATSQRGEPETHWSEGMTMPGTEQSWSLFPSQVHVRDCGEHQTPGHRDDH